MYSDVFLVYKLSSARHYVRSIMFETKGAYHLTEKSGWGVKSIMVIDLPIYRRNASLLRFKSKKGANLCSVSLELKRNREIGKW